MIYPILIHILWNRHLNAIQSPMDGDSATWFGSTAAAIAVFLTAITIYTDRKEKRKSQKLEQAVLVSSWIDGEAGKIVINNSSNEPIYNIIVGAQRILGKKSVSSFELFCEYENPEDETDHYLPLVPPGKWYLKPERERDSKLKVYGGVSIAFSDAKGNHWLRRANGTVSEIPVSAFDHFRVKRPLLDDYSGLSQLP